MQDHGLVELSCVEAAGLVLVCPTPGITPEPFDASLVDELANMLGPKPTAYATTARTWKANWKLIVEGGIESYHFRIAHKNTIAPFFGDTLSSYERMGPHMRSVLPKLSILKLQDLPQERSFLEKNHAISVHTLDEDFVIGEQSQRGIHTSANKHFRFGRMEGALSDWHRHLDAQIA